MDENLKPLIDFLHSVGAGDVSHSNKTYLAHAMGVYRDMKGWTGDDDLSRAGLFHSIYGTERFQKFAVPFEQRGRLRELIGARAERLVYVNCVMERSSFDRAVFEQREPFRIHDRIAGETIELPCDEFDDLCRLHLCDWLEQVPRSQDWDYRRSAYRQMAVRLGGVALESYDRVFAQASAKSTA